MIFLVIALTLALIAALIYRPIAVLNAKNELRILNDTVDSLKKENIQLKKQNCELLETISKLKDSQSVEGADVELFMKKGFK